MLSSQSVFEQLASACSFSLSQRLKHVVLCSSRNSPCSSILRAFVETPGRQIYLLLCRRYLNQQFPCLVAGAMEALQVVQDTQSFFSFQFSILALRSDRALRLAPKQDTCNYVHYRVQYLSD